MDTQIDAPHATQFIGIRRVCEISGFSKSTILRKEMTGEFPAAVIAEGNLKRWDLGEVLDWRQARIRERDQRQAFAPVDQPNPK